MSNQDSLPSKKRESLPRDVARELQRRSRDRRRAMGQRTISGWVDQALFDQAAKAVPGHTRDQMLTEALELLVEKYGKRSKT